MMEYQKNENSKKKAGAQEGHGSDRWTEMAEEWRKKGDNFCLQSDCPIEKYPPPKADKQRL